MQTKTIGKFLRKKRKEKEMPLEQIEFETRIPLKILHKIEEDSFQDIDDPFFVKGYIRNFGEVVGINPDLLMAMYKRDYENNGHRRNVIKNEAPWHKKIKEKVLKATNYFSIKLGLSVFGVFVLVAGLFYSYKLGQVAFEEPEIALTSPLEVTAGYTGSLKTKENAIQFTGYSGDNVEISVNGIPIKLEPNNQFRTDTFPLTDAENTFLFQATNTLGRTSTIELLVERTDTVLNKLAFTVIVNEEMSEATAIKTDGTLELEEVLQKDDVIQLAAQKYFEVVTEEFEKVDILVGDQLFSLSKEETLFRLNAESTDIVVE